ncbi:methyl-accepting chemotaxis protein [Jiella marina]|uniref:methyl-accepting chemotaxis protein n=1 Tax=Jiella sp. LLJ827 TaxID=2917712 RepID=UPI002101A59F|nr:methyl-accepting chemotaxis protein [Jiella sp. LLJ827]
MGIKGRIIVAFLPVAILAIALGLVAQMAWPEASPAPAVTAVPQPVRIAPAPAPAAPAPARLNKPAPLGEFALRASSDLERLRIAAVDFIEDGRKDSYDRFQSAASEFGELSPEDRRLLAGDAGSEAAWKRVETGIASWQSAMDQLYGLRTGEAKATGAVAESGPLAVSAMSDVIKLAWRAFDIEALYHATATFESLNASLVSAERFLRTDEGAAFDVAQSKLNEAIGRHAAMTKLMTDPAQLERARESLSLMKDYGEKLGATKDFAARMRELRAGMLITLPRALADHVATLRRAATADVPSIDPVETASVSAADGDENAATTANPGPATAGFAPGPLVLAGSILIALVALLSGFVAARKIVGPFTQFSAALTSRAQDETRAPLEEAEREDELGDIARAVIAIEKQSSRNDAASAEADARRRLGELEKIEQQTASLSAEREALEETMGTLSSGIKRLSAGEMNVRIADEMGDHSEIGEEFDRLAEKLEQTFSALSIANSSLATGLGEIFVATDDLARRTEQQAANLEQTVASLGDVSGAVAETAEGARQAELAAATAKETAGRGGDIVGRAISAMSAIEQSSQKVVKIIGVIDEIAFQTNLLALNAGVEAARAGEAGRGFAVVAQEVRGLAQRSADAAKEIKQLINASNGQVKEGVSLVTASGDSLGEIVGKVAEVSRLVAEISQRAQDQAVNLKEVSSAAEQMDQATQQNAAMVEETTAAAQNLRAETETLAVLISGFAPAKSKPKFRSAPDHGRPLHRPAPTMAHDDDADDDVTLWHAPPVRAASGRASAVAVKRATPEEDGWEEF